MTGRRILVWVALIGLLAIFLFVLRPGAPGPPLATRSRIPSPLTSAARISSAPRPKSNGASGGSAGWTSVDRT